MAFVDVEPSEYSGRPLEFYRFETGGNVYRFTSAPQEWVIEDSGTAAADGTYTPAPLFCSPVKHARDTSSLDIQINCPRDFQIAQLFRAWVPDTEMLINIYRRHQGDTDRVGQNALINWFSGLVRACDRQGSTAELICEPHQSKMQRLGLSKPYQPQCNLQLGGTRCGVDLAAFTHTVTVTDIDGLVVTVSGMPALASDYFQAGKMVRADGSRRSITLQDGSDLSLLLDFEDLEIGEEVEIVAGCKRDHETCLNKFNNILRFFGFMTTPRRNIFTEGGLTGAGASGFASLPD